MNNTGRRLGRSAALIVLYAFPIFSQSIPSNSGERLISGPQEISPGIIAAADPRVPVPQLLPEPLYTQGDSNDVFWALPDSFILDNTVIKISSCQLQFESASDADFTNDVQGTPNNKYPRADHKSYRIASTGYEGKTRWYRARTISPTISGPYGSFSEWSAPQSSISDLTPPALTSFQIVDGAGNTIDLNRWLNQSSVTLRFGLKDPAGVYNAFLTGDLPKREKVFVKSDTLRGNPGPGTVNAEWRLEQLADGQYALAFGASDAAYTPESHGPSADGKIPAVWKIAGNRSDALYRFELRIDTRPPKIDLTQIKAEYTKKDSLIIITVSDTLSGIDTASLKAGFSIVSFSSKIQPCTPAQTACFQVILTLGNISKDITDTLTVSVRDLAGNEKTERKPIRFIVEPPVLASVVLRDLDYGTSQCLAPAASYTNDAQIEIDLALAAGSKAADFLKIVNADDPTRSVTLGWPEKNSIPSFDLRSIVSSLVSGQKVSLLFYALDRYGNVQPQGVPASIIYDKTAPKINKITLADTTNPADGRKRAEPGWTNDRYVRVTLETGDALYKIEQLQPSAKCRENTLEFIETLPESDGIYEFTYQAADSAGNRSEVVSARIRRDTQMDNPTIDDFSTADDPNLAGNIRITVKSKQKWPDLSRFVVNSTVYNAANYSVSMPEAETGYTIALIDSAGNESRSVWLPPPCPRFRLTLTDTSKAPNEAAPRFTNDQVISWALSDLNFSLDKLQNIIFYDSLSSRFLTQKGADKGYIDLRQLYPVLRDGDVFKILAKAVVRNWPQCDPDSLVAAAIIYDSKRPEIEALTAQDTLKNPFPAAPGFTNDEQLKVSIKTLDQDVRTISFAGAPDDQIDGQPLPLTADFKTSFTWTLNRQGDLALHNLQAGLKDLAGNWSNEEQVSVRYLKQNIIVSSKLDTLRLSFPVPPEITVSLGVQCSHAEFLNYVFITKPDKSKDSIKVEGKTGSWQLIFDLSNPREGWYHFVVSDSAGNGSNKDSLYIDVQEPPKIRLTAFDAKTFPAFKSPTAALPADWQRSDSLYTRADSLVVLTRLVSGDWDKIKLYAGEQILYDGPVAADSLAIDLRKIALPQPEKDLQIMQIRAEAANRIGITGTASAEIIWDNRAPQLTRFNGPPLVSEPLLSFSWEGFDEQLNGSAGEPAGLLLIERYDDEKSGKREIRTLYYPIIGISGQDTLSLINKIGVHTLTALLVDKADADQNRPDSIMARINRGDKKWITHPSNSITISVRLNPIEVANFPNPFDPTKEYTSLIFPINSDDGSPVRITILDAFGRLVHKKEVVCKRRFQVGDESDTPELRWDGRNDRGEIVANGGYICIIDVLKTGERYVRKIAVLKANSTH